MRDICIITGNRKVFCPAHPTLHLKGDDGLDVDEVGHLDQLPADSVLHLKHVEEGVDQVLVNLVVLKQSQL